MTHLNPSTDRRTLRRTEFEKRREALFSKFLAQETP
jgi:hypothetical protein